MEGLDCSLKDTEEMTCNAFGRQGLEVRILSPRPFFNHSARNRLPPLDKMLIILDAPLRF